MLRDAGGGTAARNEAGAAVAKSLSDMVGVGCYTEDTKTKKLAQQHISLKYLSGWKGLNFHAPLRPWG